jgi:hypothetical protein
VYDGSQIAQDSTVVAAHMLADTGRRNWITVIWCGHNNDNNPAQVKADIASMVNALGGNNRFVVISLLNKALPTEIKGGAMYPVVLQLDADLQAAYPNNYLDMRSALIHLYNPLNAQDVQDFQNDVVPSSLRYDEIHLRQEGSSAAASILRNWLLAKGW